MIYRYYLQFDRENDGVYTFVIGEEIKQEDEFIPGDTLGAISFSRDEKFIGDVNVEARQALNEFIDMAYAVHIHDNDICCVDNIPIEQRWTIVYDALVQIAENQASATKS